VQPGVKQELLVLTRVPRSMRVSWSKALVLAATGVEPLAWPIVYWSAEALGKLASTRALTAQ
jgi:hypothetical protein